MMDNIQRVRLTDDILASSTAHDRGIISSKLRENSCQPKIVYPAKLPFKMIIK